MNEVVVYGVIAALTAFAMRYIAKGITEMPKSKPPERGQFIWPENTDNIPRRMKEDE